MAALLFGGDLAVRCHAVCQHQQQGAGGFRAPVVHWGKDGLMKKQECCEGCENRTARRRGGGRCRVAGRRMLAARASLRLRPFAHGF